MVRPNFSGFFARGPTILLLIVVIDVLCAVVSALEKRITVTC